MNPKSSMELRVKPLGIIVFLALFAIIGTAVYFFANNQGKDEVITEIAPDTGIEGAEVLFASSKTKKDWLDEQAELFNQKYADKKVKVVIEYGETRDSYQDIINGKKNVALWAPSSTQWVGALGSYWTKNRGGKLFDTAKSDEYTVYLKTPMVFITTKDKATFLRSQLAMPGKSLDNLRDMSTGKTKVPWGTFKYSYADPVNAGSGFAFLSTVVSDFSKKHPELGSSDAVVRSKPFLEYVKELSTRYVYDEPAFKGSTDLFKSFVADPSKYDLVYTYESNALKEALKNPNVAVVYPEPTATTDMSIVCFTGAKWLTPAQIKAAKLFMDFLKQKPALEAGVKTSFRTASVVDGVSLNPELKKAATQGFQESFSGIELPSYEPVNESAAAWRTIARPNEGVRALLRERAQVETAAGK
ncbi:MAG: substrate-binding domain-containing protein [Armatimonadetes bacterium]|nr:substrate-binding domain-containing protein [Armatimonadota bacterium]